MLGRGAWSEEAVIMFRRWLGMFLVSAVAMAGWLPALGPPASADGLPTSTLHAETVPMPSGIHVEAISEAYAVGIMDVGGKSHAFAVALADRPLVVRDLGTLGGASSRATAVHGSLVAGSSQTTDGRWHAFVVDVSAPDPQMVDLGSLTGGKRIWVRQMSSQMLAGLGYDPDGGGNDLVVADLTAAHPQVADVGGVGSVSAVDGSVVVGTFVPHRGALTHGFYYDGAAPAPAMVDLGTKRFDDAGYSSAVDVSGSVILGVTDTARGPRTFVYNLAADQPTMRLIGDNSPAAIQGSTVVGTLNEGYAYAYDLNTSRMLPLGSLGTWSRANDVEGTFVVGLSLSALGERIFVFDLGRPRAGMVDIGRIGDSYGPVDIAGSYVLTQDGRVLSLAYTTAPAFSTSRVRTVVSESVGTVPVTIRRAGDPQVAATVDYLTSAHGAGTDFVATAGTLRFGVGEIAKQVSVRILNDAVAEGPESLVVKLANPGPGAVLGTPRMSEIVIQGSDTRPDLWIGPRPAGGFDHVPKGYLGNDIYNTTGHGQTLRKDVPRGQTRTYFLRLFNDGALPASTFTLRAGALPTGARVHYFHGDRDITASLRSSAGLQVRLWPREEYRFDTWWPVRVEVTPQSHARIGSLQVVSLSTTWRRDSVYKDLVKGVARVVR
jgi:hypothetical protein